jgi:NAD(P)-dependent dehydrogenase (short-subunit alcohol dehydrogenase family)
MTDRPAAAAATPRPVALVVGGGSGLGAAVVQAFADRGWAVAIHAHASFAQARATVEALAAAGVPALAVTADLRDEGPVRVVVRRVAAHFGRLDAVVHCAAVRRETPLADLAADDLRAALDVGLVGAVVLAQEAGAVMARQETGGTIVLVADREADPPRPGHLAATLVAGAVPVAARALAAELAGSGVRVEAHGPEAGATAAAVAAAVVGPIATPTVGP